APGDGGAGRAQAGADRRRRRRHGRARGAEVPERRAGHAGRARSAHDDAVLAAAMLRQLNADSLRSPKLRIVNADAFGWLEQSDARFDVIVVDFPDQTNFSIGKLYTTSFYQLVDEHLNAGGYAVVQTTSPLIARRSFWTVVTTLEAVGMSTAPYHAHVPSFGEWGFILASRRPWRIPSALPLGLRFLTLDGLPALFQFPPDMARVPAEPNRLSNQILVPIFEQEWGKLK